MIEHMTTLRAHFDGRVLIPEQPVDLPLGCSLEIDVRKVGELRPLGIRVNEESGLPVFDVPPDAKTFTSEDVRRAMDEE